MECGTTGSAFGMMNGRVSLHSLEHCHVLVLTEQVVSFVYPYAGDHCSSFTKLSSLEPIFTDVFYHTPTHTLSFPFPENVAPIP